MGPKTRKLYKSYCVKECINRNKACNACYKYSRYIPKQKGEICGSEL